MIVLKIYDEYFLTFNNCGLFCENHKNIFSLLYLRVLHITGELGHPWKLSTWSAKCIQSQWFYSRDTASRWWSWGVNLWLWPSVWRFSYPWRKRKWGGKEAMCDCVWWVGERLHYQSQNRHAEMPKNVQIIRQRVYLKQALISTRAHFKSDLKIPEQVWCSRQSMYKSKPYTGVTKHSSGFIMAALQPYPKRWCRFDCLMRKWRNW